MAWSVHKYTNYLSLADPWGIGVQNMNNDLRNIQTAELILQEFEPELLVVNMQDVDVCHSNFTGYCDNLMKADYGLAHLWQTIQNTPGMANDTVLIAAPEHGRNLTENTIIDAYGRYANDHTGEDMSREIFCLVLGPSGVVVQNQTISTVTGQSVDIVPTIANVLGFDTLNEPDQGWIGRADITEWLGYIFKLKFNILIHDRYT